MDYKWFTDLPSTDPNFALFPQDPGNPSGNREGAMVYTGVYAPTFPTGLTTISLTLAPDAPAFTLAVYGMDRIDIGPLSEIITTKWAGDASPFDSAMFDGTSQSGYAIFNVTPNGRTQLDIGVGVSTVAEGETARVNGIFFSAIPEPGTLMLLATGLIGLLCYAWRKRK